ncbi:MAG TPA: flagellar basal body rod protein FlgB [Janthinobacterium sp.]|jgi:flagellar basal-body rod protein FlgB|nr:flagellar basal body rod protein FlgB [Janthinobacterium sp.]
MLGKLDQAFLLNQTALSLRSQRQEVLASNIANADTPNYKARDIDFASALNSALSRAGAPAEQPGLAASGSAGAGSAAATLATTSAKHFATSAQPAGTLADGTPLLYRMPAQGSIDGNTVDMDVERNQFADNSIRYEAGLTMVSSQIKGLLAAVQAAP